MFALLLLACIIGGAVHAYHRRHVSPRRSGELLLVWVLAGYCGVPMLAVSLGILHTPERMAEMLPLGDPGMVTAFFGWAYLGMSVMAVMTLRWQGEFLLGPAVCWAIYFAGATAVHLHTPGAHGGASHGGLLATFAAHGLVTVALVAGLLLRARGPRVDAPATGN